MTGPDTIELAGDAIAALVEQRDFLLASLDDLEAEFAAGDIDTADYVALKDDYTARAAATIRAIEAGQASVRTGPVTDRRKIAVWAAIVLLIAVGAGLVLARTAGSRGSNDLGSGDVRQSARQLLLEAQGSMGADQQRSLDLYDQVLELQPSNAEALTYRGWLTYRTGNDADAALVDLEAAVESEPGYPDARVFRAVILLDEGQAGAAADELVALDELPVVAPMIEQLLAQFKLRQRIALAEVEPIVLVDDPVPFAESGLTIEDLRLAIESLLDLDTAGRPEDALDLIDYGRIDAPADVRLVALLGWTEALAWATDGGTNTTLEQRASDALDRAVQIDPGYPDARVYRALFRSGRGDEAGVTEDLEAFAALDEQPIRLQQLLARQGF